MSNQPQNPQIPTGTSLTKSVKVSKNNVEFGARCTVTVGDNGATAINFSANTGALSVSDKEALLNDIVEAVKARLA